MELPNNQNLNTNQSLPSSSFKKYLPYLLIVLGIAVVGVGGWFGWKYYSQNYLSISQNSSSSSQADSKRALAPRAAGFGSNGKVINKISLKSSQAQLAVGQKLVVDIVISSQAILDGADVILVFDPKFLQPESVVTPIKVSSLFDEYPFNQVDTKNNLILASGITRKSQGISGSGSFGLVTFLAKAPGSSEVKVMFNKAGDTSDSNLTQHKSAKDILAAVDNLSVKVIP